jgi:hypothetical protein
VTPGGRARVSGQPSFWLDPAESLGNKTVLIQHLRAATQESGDGIQTRCFGLRAKVEDKEADFQSTTNVGDGRLGKKAPDRRGRSVLRAVRV